MHLKLMAGLCGKSWIHRREKLQLLPNKQFLPVLFFPSMEIQYCISALVITHQICFSQWFGACFFFSLVIICSCFCSLYHSNLIYSFSVSLIGGEKVHKLNLSEVGESWRKCYFIFSRARAPALMEMSPLQRQPPSGPVSHYKTTSDIPFPLLQSK